jgi:hypothetical protein
MFTLFHVIRLVGMAFGMALGLSWGVRLLGPVGGVLGAIAGGLLGLLVGRLPELLALCLIARDLRGKSENELRESLHRADCPTPNCVLLELRRRGVDIEAELPVVLEMLVAEDMGRRSHGWAALTSAFPEQARQIAGYRISDPVEECRRKIEPLRRIA